MRKLNITLIALVLLKTINSYSQDKNFKAHTIAFYNLENLFDPEDDPNKFDENSPIMAIKNDRSLIYKKKVHNMARVIADIGLDVTNNTPAIIGVAEVENIAVLEAVVNDSLLINKDYGIVHFDSPDIRGIDVGLLYQKGLFIPTHKSNHPLKIHNSTTKKRIYTRDQLLVSGKLDGELIHILVNHWPSRRGGEATSRWMREAAAKVNKHLIDSLQSKDPYAKIITMGDLNDNPTNSSIKKILKAKHKRKTVGLKEIYNPMEAFYKKGLGSNAYADSWSLFDQIMITQPFLEKDYSSFRFYKAGIFNKNYLVNKKGRFKGYPFRSFANDGFTNGYSDHFPVYIYLIKEALD